jgi:CNT family concentrative nucleoside transporter
MEHNASPQHHVAKNLDPALDEAHEHHHEHLHHSANAEKGRHDDPSYSIGTTNEKSTIPDQDPLDHALHRRNHPERHMSEKDVKDPSMAYDDKASYDVEDGRAGPGVANEQEADPKNHKFARFYRRFRIFFHLAIFLLFTG